VAFAILGPNAKLSFAISQTDAPAEGLAQAPSDITFLAGGTLADQRLRTTLIPGPIVFIDAIRLLVPEASPARTPADLAGKTICLIIGSPAQRALEATLGTATPNIARLSFSEDIELLDAYNVGHCDAAVDDTTRLTEMLERPGINRQKSRLLNPPLALTPVLAATNANDPAWSQLVTGILQTLIANARPPSAWRPQAHFEAEGLRPNWEAELHATAGGYIEMRNRTIGPTPWPNAPWPQGLLLPIAAD
jgi:general L-amino acid transport system substrate-binding protein